MSRALASFTVQCPSCRSSFPVDPEKVPDGGIYAICAQCDRTFLVTQPEGVGSTEGAAAATEPAGDIEPGWGGDFSSGSSAAVDEQEAESEEAVGDFDLTMEEPEDTPAPEAPSLDAEPGEAPAAETPKVEFEPEVEFESEVESESEGAQEAEAAREAPGARAPEPESPAAFEDLRGLASEAVSDTGGGSSHTGGSTLSSGAQKFGRRDPQDRAKRLARVLVSDIIAYYPERFQESRARGTVKEDFESEVQKSWKEYVDQVGEELAESTPYFTEALNEILGGGEEIF